MEILFTKDFLRKVADKTGYSMDMVEVNYMAIVNLLDRLSVSPDVGSINIPHLGRMYFKLSRGKHAYRETYKKYPYSESTKRLKEKIDNLEREIEQGFSHHKSVSRIRVFSNVFKGDVLKLQEKQNEAYEQSKKN